MPNVWLYDFHKGKEFFFFETGKSGNQNLFGIDVILQKIIGTSGNPGADLSKIFCPVQMLIL